ncbi:IS481 family transposase, partial [Corynebacterium lehmanniae]|nr:IS481 family transposase [Corynebacterium lehmanniae]
KATPNDNPKEEWRTRNDTVDKNGKVSVRYAGKLFHLGIGRTYKHKKILMVITDNHIITSLVETGEVITEHYIDTARDYQKAYWKHG